MKKLYLCLILLILVNTQYMLGTWQLPVTNFQQKDYASGTQSWQIKQQKNGWMYFANNYGLLEFDGYNWNTYGVWNSTVIRSLEIADSGEIYVGATNEFGRFSSNDLGKLSYQPLSNDLPAEYKNFGEVWNIHLLKGELYVQTRNYIFKSSGKKFSVIESEARIVCSAKIRESIYVGTTNGIYLLAGDQLIALSGSELLKNKNICAIQPWGKSGVLVGTSFNGMFRFDGKTITPFETEADDFIRKNQLYACAINDSTIAFGTVLNGLLLTDINGRNCRYINSENGLQNNTILSMEFDHNDNLWLGLDQGIDRIDINSSLSSLYGTINFRGSGYTSCIHGDKLYLGTNQGLYYVKWPLSHEQRLTNLTLIDGTQGQIWDLDVLGETLFCSHNRGLFQIGDNGVSLAIGEEGIWQIKILPATPDYAVAGSYSGFYLLKRNGTKWEVKKKLKGFNATCRVFEIDESNNIWISPDAGLCKLTLNQTLDSIKTSVIKTYQQVPHEIYTINKMGNDIIISNPWSIYSVSGKGEFSECKELYKLLDGPQLYSLIKKDEENNIWFIATNKMKVRLYNGKKKSYEPGLISLCEQPNFFIGGFEHLFLLKNRQAIVGSISGFSLVEVNNKLKHPIVPKTEILVRRVVSTNLKDSLIYGQGYPIRPKIVSLPFVNNSIRIEYSGVNSQGEELQYAYMLEPVDHEWSEWTTAKIKEYTTLKEGDYKFLVKASSSLSDEISYAEFTFTIQPPWYRTIWAYLAYFLVVMIALFLVYRHFRRKIKESWRKLEQRKNEEMKEQEKQFLHEAHNKEKEIIKLKNERLEYELKVKSQELANVLLNHLNKNEILTEIKSDLKKVITDVNDKDSDSARKRILMLQNKIGRNIEQNIDWDKFEENFDVVNDRFIQKLSEKYPTLNKNERRLCTYIKMGLSSKEIAPLMNLSLRGVEVLRYRMRKKLDFERGSDFLEFFQAIMSSENNGE